MYIIDYIDLLNEKIASLVQKESYLTDALMGFKEETLSSMKGYQDEDYIVRKGITDDNNEFTLSRAKTTAEVRREINDVTEEINSLERKRDNFIDTVLKNANFSVLEVIKILELFKIYYKPINLVNKTLLAPQNFTLTNGVGDGASLDTLTKLSKTHDATTTVMPMYRKDTDYVLGTNEVIADIASEIKINESQETKGIIAKIKALLNITEEEQPKHYDLKGKETFIKTSDGVRFNEEILKDIPQGVLRNILVMLEEHKKEIKNKATTIKFNDRLMDLVPALMVEDNNGVAVYNRVGNSISLNKDVLNIFPDEVLGFVLSYIQEKCSGNVTSIEEAYQNFYKANRSI